jgi:hypothetical protein
MNKEAIFRHIIESCKEKSSIEKFLSLKMERLQEMGHNSSLATARNYINIAEQKRKQNIDIWDENVIDEIIIEVIRRGKGKGIDKRFNFTYTPQEKNFQNSTETWIDNVMDYIKKWLSDIAPDLQVFKTIRDKFMNHLKGCYKSLR